MDTVSKDYFETVAPHWEQMRSNFFPDSLKEIVFETARIQAGRTAADVGAGSGFITQGLLERGLRVIAVDQSPKMLEELKRRFPAADCRTGESGHLPVADASVDYVFANMYLHHVPDPANALKEMTRILLPGGTLVLTDIDRHDHQFLREEHHDLWMGFERDQIDEWLRGAGLTDVEVTCAGSNCCAASEDRSDEASISIFLARGSTPEEYSVGDKDDHANRIVRRAAELSREHFLSGFYCAESVLKAMADIHGHRDPMIPKIATGFCGGMSRTSGICGALAGGIMAMGLFTGRSQPTDPKDQCYALVHHLVNRFVETFGSTHCTELLGCDISTAEGARIFEKKNLLMTRCAVITGQTAGLVEEIYARRDTIRHPLL